MLLTHQDIYHFREGTFFRAYEKLGAHLVTKDAGSPARTRFAVWAPNASAVSVVGDFNGWNRTRTPLAPREDSSGIWEGVVDGVGAGALYKYHVVSQHAGFAVDKSDPYAYCAEAPPRTASVVWDLDYRWGDGEWMGRRAAVNTLGSPWSIYELHLGSWRRVPQEHNRYPELPRTGARRGRLRHRARLHTRRTAAGHGAPVLRLVGLPGHTGYFAPTARYGTPQDF